ncbi:MAG: hypothetical protein R2865_10160 [Deinococcales bacterium]
MTRPRPPAASHHQHITHAQEQIEKLSTNLERETAKETSRCAYVPKKPFIYGYFG